MLNLPEGGRRPRVLVADDEQIIAETLQIILTREEFEVISVQNGEAAVQKAQDWRPDLFLSDVMMPGLNGIQAAIQIRALIPECKIILMSGKAAVVNMLRDARQLGHDFELVIKPIHPTELVQILRYALKR